MLEKKDEIDSNGCSKPRSSDMGVARNQCHCTEESTLEAKIAAK